MKIKTLFLAAMVALLATSCVSDSDDSGNVDLSNLVGAFAEAHSDANCKFDCFFTDDGYRYYTEQLYDVNFMKTPDSLYRVSLLYYKPTSTVNNVKVYSMSLIPTLIPKALPEDKQMKTDPVHFNSAWTSESGNYVNLQLTFMTAGNTSATNNHTIDIIEGELEEQPDGTTMRHLTFYHDRANVSEYYEAEYYASIPCSEIGADSVQITINTYGGSKIVKLPAH